MSELEILCKLLRFFVEKILNQKTDNIINVIQEYKSKNALEEAVINQLIHEWNTFKNTSANLDFDFEALVETIFESGFKESSIINILSIDKKQRDLEHETIVKLCIEKSHAKDTASKNHVCLVIDHCYQVIHEFYFSKNSNASIELAIRGIDSINSCVEETADSLASQINNQFDNSNSKLDYLISLMQNYQSYSLGTDSPLEHIRSDNKQYYEMYRTSLFLDQENPLVTLENLYVEPFVKEENIPIFEYLFNWLKSNDHCLLLYGEAGIGKSCLTSKLVDNACHSKSGSMNPEKAPVLAVALRDHCEIFKSIQFDYSAKDVLLKLFGINDLHLLENKLIILDGYDELNVLIPRFKEHMAGKFLENLGIACHNMHLNIHIIVTSREGYFSFKNFNECYFNIATLYWKESNVEQWCNKYSKYKPEIADWCSRFLVQYRELPRNNEKDRRFEILCIPFILYLSSNSRIDLEQNHTLCQIYDYSFRTLLLRKHGKDLVGAERLDTCLTDKQHQIVFWQYAKELAYQMFLLNVLSLSETNEFDLEYEYRRDDNFGYYNYYLDSISETPGIKRAKSRTIKIIQEAHGFRISEQDLNTAEFLALFSFANGYGDRGIAFAHKTVYEYFTAIKIFEDYFALFNNPQFISKTETEKTDIVIRNSIEAFRYRDIPQEVFEFILDLCKKGEKPWCNTLQKSSASFSFEKYLKYFKRAEEEAFECRLYISDAIDEYLVLPLDHYADDCVEGLSVPSIISQLSTALRNLTWFLSGQGFVNSGYSSLPWISVALAYNSVNPVNLNGWNISRLVKDGITLYYSQMRSIDCSIAYFPRSTMIGCDLSNSNFEGTCMGSSILSRSCFIKANLNDADLQRSILDSTDFTSAELCNSNLRGASMKKANLNNANLCCADLCGADLRGAEINGTNFFNAYYSDRPDYKTLFPKGFDPEQHHMRKNNDLDKYLYGDEDPNNDN